MLKSHKTPTKNRTQIMYQPPDMKITEQTKNNNKFKLKGIVIYSKEITNLLVNSLILNF